MTENSANISYTAVKSAPALSARSVDTIVSYAFPTLSSVNSTAFLNENKTNSNCKFLPQLPLEKYKLNSDPNPEIIRKKPAEKIIYKQDVSIKFLEPPQLPKPGDIVVRQLPNRQIAPAPPLIVRQTPLKPATPPPLIIREVPPVPPPTIASKLVYIPGKVLAPPARKVVIERLPSIPPKPQKIFIEKWLPYQPQKRRVIFERAQPDCVIPNPRNLIIQWENPEVEVIREYTNLGTQLVDPQEYVRRHGSELLNHQDFVASATKIGAPDSVVILNSHRELGLPELEGDIEALKFIDLDIVGLSEYKSYLSGLGVSYNPSLFTLASNPYGLITSANSNNLISIEKATSVLNNLNAGPERPISQTGLRNYFSSIDTN